MATGLENLWIYRLAEDLEVKVHEITKNFPRDELYRSVDQLRRSSSAVANNIAESYHKTTNKEKIRFIDIAKGEAEETKRNIIKSARKNLIDQRIIDPLISEYTKLLKGLFAYSKFLAFNNQKPTNHNQERKTKN